MNSDYSKLITDFKQSAHEALGVLKEEYGQLKDENSQKDKVEGRMFQATHNLKGLFGMMRVKKAYSLCSSLELLIWGLWEDELKIDTKVFEAVESAIGCLEVMVESTENDDVEEVDTTEVMRKFGELVRDEE